jgi:hypothetical protein
LSEKRASIARTVFVGALERLKIDIALDLKTDGKAFLRSTKQEKYGNSLPRTTDLATVERIK